MQSVSGVAHYAMMKHGVFHMGQLSTALLLQTSAISHTFSLLQLYVHALIRAQCQIVYVGWYQVLLHLALNISKPLEAPVSRII